MPTFLTEQGHIERHKVLHKHFDELLADFIDKTSRNLSQTNLIEFVKWSHEQSVNPTPDALFGRIQAAAEWCQQTEHEFIKAGITDRLDEVEPLMAGWDEGEGL